MRLGWLLVLVAAPVAMADDVPPPPEDCPSGARGQSDHWGEVCGPFRCRDDDDCAGRYVPPGRVCREASFCVEEKDYTSHRGHSGTYEVFQGACDASGACGTGECERARYCVDPDDPLEPAAAMTSTRATERESPATSESPTDESEESGCSAARGASGSSALALLLVLTRRRGRRSRLGR